MSRSGNLDKYITNLNSCPFEIQTGERGGIRLKIQFDYIYI